jgi:arylsulfatase A-like enzyme
MKRPNILFILSDDQGAWALGCAGNSEIETPHLDRLAASGVRFENFFCTSPVCSPARASLLTGQIPSQHGVHDWIAAGNTTAKFEPERNGKLIEYLKEIPGYTDYLSEIGYSCGLSGKWHLGDAHHSQKSFDFWEVHAMGGGPYYGAPMIRNSEVYEESRYVTDVITDNALSWLDHRKAEENPFYLGVHYTAPHSPWQREHHPADLYDHYFNDCAFASVPDGLRPPEWVEYQNIPVSDSKTRRDHLSGYFAAVTAMDANVGRLLDWLEKNEKLEDTLVVFTSDNGMNMGHHGVFGKGNATYPLNMFEESIKVPFIMSHPGCIQAGGTNSDLLSQYDFMPTLLEYVGCEVSSISSLPGKSFNESLCNESSKRHEHIVVFDEYGPVRMVRTERYKYVHRYESGLNELYDLENDPKEERNLIGELEWRATEKEMQDRLFDWFSNYVDPERDGSREKVTGSGQLGLCGGDNFSKLRRGI